jgi:ADP-ribosylglycohydrolase
LEDELKDPPEEVDENILNRVQGSMIGMALGDAVGAPVASRPHQYLMANPVTDLKGGGTWNLKKGQVSTIHKNFIAFS